MFECAGDEACGRYASPSPCADGPWAGDPFAHDHRYESLIPESFVPESFVPAVSIDPELTGLEDQAPGPELANLLARLELADLTDDALVEVVAAAERLRSWTLAVQARAAVELSARAGGSSTALEGASLQIAARLCLTRPAADTLLGLGAGLDDLPVVADALATGRLDQRRANAILDGLAEVDREGRHEIAAALVGSATAPGPACRVTPPRVRERVRRLVATRDPAGAERRRVRARADRHVRFDPTTDGSVLLSALLPADDAARARAHLEAVAVATHRSTGESRTLDQVRADTLVKLLTGARPFTPCGGDCIAGRAPRADDAAPTDRPTSSYRWEATGSRRATTWPPAEAATGVAWTAPTVRTVVHVTVAASTLLGLDDAAGDLAGVGPIPADLARRLAAGQDTTWQRILTDPATGIVTDVSRRTYSPGRVMGDLVRTRDATCTFPGCAVPAWRCDLDHVEPFDHASDPTGGEPPPGQTRTDNLHPVCRRHHNAKTHGGWATSRDGAGNVTWTAPTGHTHQVGAHVADPARRDRDLSRIDTSAIVAANSPNENSPVSARTTSLARRATTAHSPLDPAMPCGVATPHGIVSRRRRHARPGTEPEPSEPSTEAGTPPSEHSPGTPVVTPGSAADETSPAAPLVRQRHLPDRPRFHLT
ncbi:hypothetical protein GCM10025864_06970 [Luteimicrobium album]|uniref:DUF222 domain-containing protein n=1 Tax=Luteimicrobium album TaxID=1054550 RepID=A0ABQ6HYI8_9MICO|nr:HNH endonuclease [Luteimicrobium album]GMA22938.1 hypothetical protein GCM10025864_06970 [Luteimicrobium album]